MKIYKFFLVLLLFFYTIFVPNIVISKNQLPGNNLVVSGFGLVTIKSYEANNNSDSIKLAAKEKAIKNWTLKIKYLLGSEYSDWENAIYKSENYSFHDSVPNKFMMRCTVKATPNLRKKKLSITVFPKKTNIYPYNINKNKVLTIKDRALTSSRILNNDINKGEKHFISYSNDSYLRQSNNNKKLINSKGTFSIDNYFVDIDQGVPTVSFTIEDYLELGNIREKVITGYQEIRVQSKNTKNAINYSNMINNTLSNLNLTNISSPMSDILSTALTLNTINEASQSETIDDIRRSLSSLDISNTLSNLQQISSSISKLNSQLNEPIQLPSTLFVYYAVAVSTEARRQIKEMLNDAETGKQSLINVIGSIRETKLMLKNYLSKLRSARIMAIDIRNVLKDYMWIPLTYYTVIDLVLIEGDTEELIRKTHKLASKLDPVTAKTEKRLLEIQHLILHLEYLLSIPPLSSQWTTSANVGATNAYYALSFTGRSFSHEGTEIDGPFKIGVLKIHNYITPNTGNMSLNAKITFSINRSVKDPVLGQQSTTNSVSLGMLYYVTENDKNNTCGSSRDYFNISSLGVNLKICEDNGRGFLVYGQYDSPLRIVKIEALPDDFDPDPAVETVNYLLDVIGGEGTGIFEKSEIVSAVANIKDDEEFVFWECNNNLSIDKTHENITFSMPPETVTLKAIFRSKRQNFELSVIDGTGSGKYPNGTEVPIEADEKHGFLFSHWSGDTSNLISKDTSQSFIVVEQDIVLKAEYIESYTDTDSDGTPDIYDDCPIDPNKVLKGVCGCGIEDIDHDGDGIPDCDYNNKKSDSNSCFITSLYVNNEPKYLIELKKKFNQAFGNNFFLMFSKYKVKINKHHNY